MTMTLDRLTLNSCRTWRVTWSTLQPSLKIIRLFVHELRVIMVLIDYHWKCVRGHCACAESRDQWVWGQKQLHVWHPRTRFAYSLYNCCWAPTTIKGRLLASRPMLKPLSGEQKFCPVEVWPKNGGFWKMGVQTLDIGIATPHKALPRVEPRRLTYFASKSVRDTAAAFLKDPKNRRVTLYRGARNHAYAEPKPIWITLHSGRYHRRSHVHEFCWPSAKGVLGVTNFTLFHRLRSPPLKH